MPSTLGSFFPEKVTKSQKAFWHTASLLASHRTASTLEAPYIQRPFRPDDRLWHGVSSPHHPGPSQNRGVPRTEPQKNAPHSIHLLHQSQCPGRPNHHQPTSETTDHTTTLHTLHPQGTTSAVWTHFKCIGAVFRKELLFHKSFCL